MYYWFSEDEEQWFNGDEGKESYNGSTKIMDKGCNNVSMVDEG